MTPLAPLLPPAALAPADPQARAAAGTAPAGATPTLGTEAVTALQAARPITPRAAPRDTDTPARVDPFEPPSDPPPVKGLGIPALHTARVGDLDILDDPLPLPIADKGGDGFASSRPAVEPAADPKFDLRR